MIPWLLQKLRAIQRRIQGLPEFSDTKPKFVISLYYQANRPIPENLGEAIETALLRIREKMSTISLRTIPLKSWQHYWRGTVELLEKNEPLHFLWVAGCPDMSQGMIWIADDKKHIVVNDDMVNGKTPYTLRTPDGRAITGTCVAHEGFESYIMESLVCLAAMSKIETENPSQDVLLDIRIVASIAFRAQPVRSAIRS
jgi:hypothetical protein